MNPNAIPPVDILLAAYNGEQFLPTQLESIFSQTFQEWRLIARDDGSSDRTPALLEEAARACPGQVTLLANPGERLGAVQSFDRLMRASSARYLLFCDQDDLWRPEKIGKMLAAIQKLEQQHGDATPLLVHSDLRVVDQELQPLSESFWKYQKLDPRRGEAFNKLLTQNVVTGSAVMINRRLCELGRPIPPEAAMHDWWLALTAAAFGRIGFIAEPLVDYRQHQANRIGAKQWGAAYVLRAAVNRTAAKAGLELSQRQARAFYARHGDVLPARLGEVAAGYARITQMGFLQRRGFIWKHSLWKTGLSRNLGLLFWI